MMPYMVSLTERSVRAFHKDAIRVDDEEKSAQHSFLPSAVPKYVFIAMSWAPACAGSISNY